MVNLLDEYSKLQNSIHPLRTIIHAHPVCKFLRHEPGCFANCHSSKHYSDTARHRCAYSNAYTGANSNSHSRN